MESIVRIFCETVPDDTLESGRDVRFQLIQFRRIFFRDRIQDAIKKGKTLEQVKADRLTRDYDTYYGSTAGEWTTDMFVAAVYNSLKK